MSPFSSRSTEDSHQEQSLDSSGEDSTGSSYSDDDSTESSDELSEAEVTTEDEQGLEDKIEETLVRTSLSSMTPK